MNELYDDGRTRGIDGPVEWARLEAGARKMLESGLELADRVEAAQDINRIPNSRTPGRLASDRALHHLSRHYQVRRQDEARGHALPEEVHGQGDLLDVAAPHEAEVRPGLETGGHAKIARVDPKAGCPRA